MTDNVRQIFVDGSWTDAGTDEVDIVINPATEQTIAQVGRASREDAMRALRAARKAFDEGPWGRTSTRERADILRRMGEIMQRRSEEIAALNVAEAGSVGWQSQVVHTNFPIDAWMDMVDRTLPAYSFERPLTPMAGMGGLTQGVVRQRPAGVAALITGYNFPFFLNLFKLGPALAAGCTTVLKPSPYTPLEALVLGEIAEEAGLPAGVLNVLTGDVEVGELLTTSPLVDMVSFTGSDIVGSKIATQAAPSFKRVVLELGGKSASIIRADADLEKAIADVLLNSTIQAGQGCSLTTRTFVHRSIFDEVVSATSKAMQAMKIGDPADATVEMGPLIREAQRAKVEALIAKGIEEGGELVTGGGRPAGLDKGFYVEPTLFTNVDNTSTIATTEFFGPVQIINPFDTDEEAVALANESLYGLGGGIWSKDASRAYDMAKQIRSGFVTINGQGGFNLDAPFGGFGASGIGRERGPEAIAEYLQSTTVTWGCGA